MPMQTRKAAPGMNVPRSRMTREQYKHFLKNASASGSNETMSIDLGSICGVGCTFCFNESDFSDRLVHLPFITEEDLDDALDLVNVYKNPVISIGGGKHVWWGEPTAHPQFERLCHRINERYPDAIIEVDTAGLYLTPARIKELQTVHNLRFYLSVNTLDEEIRRRYYRMNKINIVYDMLENLDVQVANLKYHGDDSSFVRDMHILSGYKGIKFISPHKIHWTKFSDAGARELSIASLSSWSRAMQRVYAEADDVRIIAECNFMHDDVDQKSRLFSAFDKLLYDVIKLQIERFGDKFTLCAAESTFPYIREHFPHVDAIVVKNVSYGGSITASGQMNFEDVELAISTNPRASGTTYIIPSDMINDRGYDRLNVSLTDVNKRIQTSYDCSVKEANLKRWIYLPQEYMDENFTG